MENFINQVSNRKLQQMLGEAIQRKKPFQQFKSLIDYYPDVLKEWYAFKNHSYREYVKEIINDFNSIGKDVNEDEDQING